MSHNLYREAHPLPFVITHWINLLAMIFLVLTGFYIHYPFTPGLMGVARGTHSFWMMALLINLVVRVVLMFVVKDANMPDTREVDYDYKNWLPQAANRHQMWPWVKYYMYLKKDHPISAKYGVLQKSAYIMTPFLILAAAYTGFCLWAPTSNWPIFMAGTTWIASMFNLGGGAHPIGVRIVHYWTMWVILIFTVAHAYLALHNLEPAKMIFAWKESIHGEKKA